MKRWKCTVCGYIHEGEEPPETCPVCGADRSKFIEISPAEDAVEKTARATADSIPASRWQRFSDVVTRLMTQQHAHPISVHIPNGVLPVAVVFLLGSLFLDSPGLSQASFYNMLVVALAMPVVLFSGYNDWRRLFDGRMTALFLTKMICGGLLLILAPVSVIWRAVDPTVLDPDTGTRMMYLLMHLVMFAAAVLAGFLGGKLVIFRGLEK